MFIEFLIWIVCTNMMCLATCLNGNDIIQIETSITVYDILCSSWSLQCIGISTDKFNKQKTLCFLKFVQNEWRCRRRMWHTSRRRGYYFLHHIFYLLPDRFPNGLMKIPFWFFFHSIETMHINFHVNVVCSCERFMVIWICIKYFNYRKHALLSIQNWNVHGMEDG